MKDVRDYPHIVHGYIMECIAFAFLSSFAAVIGYGLFR